ncbi:MAG TPA: glycerophosphodiester phosphodiesterase family protein [Oculatellaceae cyanobacterium]
MISPAKVKVFAHRGGRAHYPENTLVAFAGAMKAGVHGIELDVQRCASGELVVFHDVTLARTTNGQGRLADTTLDDLKKLSAGAWYRPEFESERVPTLLEVLDLVDGTVVVNIEVKNCPVDYPGIEDDLLQTIGHYKYPDQLIISSFDHQLLKAVSEKSDLEVAILSAGVLHDISGYSAALNANFWHPEFELLRPDAVEEAHLIELKVNTWTVNGPDDWKQALEANVDGIITDDPDGLIEFLDQLTLVSESIC